jgi:hypothetical protein
MWYIMVQPIINLSQVIITGETMVSENFVHHL